MKMCDVSGVPAFAAMFSRAAAARFRFEPMSCVFGLRETNALTTAIVRS